MGNAMQVKRNWSKCWARKNKKWEFEESIINRSIIKEGKKLIRNRSAKYCAVSIVRIIGMVI
jgi:hypothetical protein